MGGSSMTDAPPCRTHPSRPSPAERSSRSMAAVVEVGGPVRETTDDLRPAYCLLAAPAAVVVTVVALAHLDEISVGAWVSAALVVAWAVGGALVGLRRRDERIGPIALAIAGIGALGMVASSYDHPTVVGIALGLLPAAGLHLLAALPDGRLTRKGSIATVAMGYALGALVGAFTHRDSDGNPKWPSVTLWVFALAIGMYLSHQRYVAANATDRRRMQWVGWAMAVDAELVLVIVALRLISAWPPQAAVVALATTVLIPASLVAGTHVKMIARVDRLLTQTVALAGLTAIIIAAYIAVVVALGRGIEDGERPLLLL